MPDRRRAVRQYRAAIEAGRAARPAAGGASRRAVAHAPEAPRRSRPGELGRRDGNGPLDAGQTGPDLRRRRAAARSPTGPSRRRSTSTSLRGRAPASSSTSRPGWSSIPRRAIPTARWSTRCSPIAARASPASAACKRPGIVHRLDKDTSGLMVVAKTELAHARARRRLRRAPHRRAPIRRWSGACPARRSGEIDGADRPQPARPQEDGGGAARRQARRSPAIACCAPSARAAALVECRLATGRTHQIRVHLSARGHPLIGDRDLWRAAGAARRPRRAPSRRFPRQALHAYLLGFIHPATGEAAPLRKQLAPGYARS